jgi:hypothetical protein
MIVSELDRHLLLHRLEDMEREQRGDAFVKESLAKKRSKAHVTEAARLNSEITRRQIAMGELQSHLTELELAAGEQHVDVFAVLRLLPHAGSMA